MVRGDVLKVELDDLLHHIAFGLKSFFLHLESMIPPDDAGL